MSEMVKQIFLSRSKKRSFFGALFLVLLLLLLVTAILTAIFFSFLNAKINQSLLEVKKNEAFSFKNTTVFYNTNIPNAYHGLSQNIFSIDRVVFDILKDVPENKDSEYLDDHYYISSEYSAVREIINSNNDSIKKYNLISEEKIINILKVKNGKSDYLISLSEKLDFDGYYLEINNKEVEKNKVLKDLIKSLKDSGLEIILYTNLKKELDPDFISQFDYISLNIFDSNSNTLYGNFSAKKVAELANTSKKNIEIIIPKSSKIISIANSSVKNKILSASEYYNLLQSDYKKYHLNLTTKEANLKKADKNILIADDVSLYFFLNKNKNLFEKYNIELAVGDIGQEIADVWPIVEKVNQKIFYLSLKNSVEVDYMNNVSGKGTFYEIITDKSYGKRRLILKGVDINNISYVSPPVKAKINKFGYQEGKISLTFDDGPDPYLTPKVLDILKERNIKATFFVTGKNANRYPDIIKRIIKDGHNIGNHSYSHPSTDNLNIQEIELEMSLTNKIIKGIIGEAPRFYRTPYTTFGEYRVSNNLINLIAARNNKLLIQEADVNSNDWVAEDGENVLSSVIADIEKANSSQILLHDYGGDRSPTLEALPKIIDYLLVNNFEIIRSDNLDLRTNNSNVITFEDALYYEMIRISRLFTFILIQITTAALIFEFIKLILGFVLFFRHHYFSRKKNKFNIDFVPPVSIIIPGYNEEKVILKTIESLLKTDYPIFEIIFSDDGSKDNSVKIVREKYKNNPLITIITKRNGGKSSALNFGIKKAKYNFVVCIDADSQFFPNTIRKMISEFRDDEVGGVAGFVYVGNHNNFLTRNQHLEYIVSQFFFKTIQQELGAIAVIPGCVGAFRKEILLKVGMYESDTLAEDTDITIKIQKAGYKVVMNPEAVAVTEAPEMFEQFFKQRMRWKFGTLQILMKHKNIFLNPKYGFLGLYVFLEMFLGFLFSPYLLLTTLVLVFTFFVALSKVIEPNFFLSLMLTGDFIKTFVLTNFMLLILYTLIASLSILIYNKKELFKFSTFFYIGMTYFLYQVVIWYITCVATMEAILGIKVNWGHLKRNGNVKLLT